LCVPHDFKGDFYKRSEKSSSQITSNDENENPNLKEFIILEGTKNIFRGRLYRVGNYDSLLKEVTSHLKTETVRIFLFHVFEILKMKKIKRIPSSYFWRDASLIYLYWLISNSPFEKIQDEFKMSRSSAYTVIKFFSSIVT
jgi:hypothetical protein